MSDFEEYERCRLYIQDYLRRPFPRSEAQFYPPPRRWAIAAKINAFFKSHYIGWHFSRKYPHVALCTPTLDAWLGYTVDWRFIVHRRPNGRAANWRTAILWRWGIW